MSVTTTDNPATSAVLEVLTDYDLHHSGSTEDDTQAPAPAPNIRNEINDVPNPTSWPTEHRRVPHYRPINRNLDVEQRPGGLNAPEAVFIFTMLSGCRINSVS